jgi:hypothetical protein
LEPEQQPQDKTPDDNDDDRPSNKGKMIVDATCTPADIAYPTDLNLLNEAREKTEAMIDTMHAPLVGKSKKPRTYRRKARKDYLAVAKQKGSACKSALCVHAVYISYGRSTSDIRLHLISQIVTNVLLFFLHLSSDANHLKLFMWSLIRVGNIFNPRGWSLQNSEFLHQMMV